MDYGMSRLGRLSLRTKETSFINGEEGMKSSALSENTAAKIDAEVEYIMETAFNETKKVLENHRFKLEALAEALLLKEVIDSEELSKILDDETN